MKINIDNIVNMFDLKRLELKLIKLCITPDDVLKLWEQNGGNDGYERWMKTYGERHMDIWADANGDPKVSDETFSKLMEYIMITYIVWLKLDWKY